MQRQRGDRIGPFEVTDLLGSGGTGEVYRCVREDGEVVAVKVLTSTSPVAAAHFERELRATPVHPRIRRVFRAGEEADGTRWLEMAYLEGQSLRERMARALSPAEVVALGVQVCEALEASHARGVVHRDLKPENLFLLGDGIDVRVVDFSIALLQDAERLTRTGTILGTFQYMSPEQVRGGRDIDARSDLWSLGAILYECLCGRSPFHGPSLAAVVYNISFCAPEPVAAACPTAPAQLAEVIQRALDKRPEGRFAGAVEMRAALLAVDPGAPARRAPGPTARPASMAAERVLVSLVSMRGVTDLEGAAARAATYGGVLVPFAERHALVRFGGESLRGDEPERALLLACASLAGAEGVGVATGWMVLPDGVEGSALAARADACANAHTVTLDEATVAALRGRVPLPPPQDGVVSLDAPQAGSLLARGGAVWLDDPASVEPGTTFVGRIGPLSALSASLDATERAGMATVVVVGDAGVGKSRLLREALSRARGDHPRATIVATRCTSYRRDLPLAAWQELLAPHAPQLDLLALVRNQAIAPEVVFDLVTAAIEPVVRALAVDGPLVVAIDDAQWLDGMSSRVIAWLLENATELPVALWLFGRPDRWPDALGLPETTSRVTLEPLSARESEALARALLGDAPATVLDRAAGNPLLLEELARMHASGSAELAHDDRAGVIDLVFNARLARLDAARRDFVLRAAVFGRVAWVEAVQQMGGDTGAWRKLLAERLVQRNPQSSLPGAQEFAFTPGLMAEAAYRVWTADALPPLHGAAARWLAAHPEASPREVGRHWEAADARDEAAASYATAAELTSRAGDAELTRELVRRVLELTASGEVCWRALAAQDSVFQLYADKTLHDAQERGLDRMRHLANDLSLRHSVETAWRQCYFYRITGKSDLTRVFGEEAIALAPALDDETDAHRWASAAHNELALLHADAGEFDDALRHAREARAHAAHAGDPWWAARTCFSEAYAIIEMDRLEDALALFDEAAAGYAAAGDLRRHAIAQMNGGFTLLRLGRLDDAAARFEAARALSRKVGNRRTVGVTAQNLSTLHRMRGALVEAEAELDVAARAAAALSFSRLDAAVLLERAALARARNLPAQECAEHALAAWKRAVTVGSPALVAQALALHLRAASAAADATASREAEARAAIAKGRFSPEGSAALAATLHALSGSPDDLELARSRVAIFLERAVRVGDRRACAVSLALRYGLDPASVAALVG